MVYQQASGHWHFIYFSASFKLLLQSRIQWSLSTSWYWIFGRKDGNRIGCDAFRIFMIKNKLTTLNLGKSLYSDYRISGSWKRIEGFKIALALPTQNKSSNKILFTLFKRYENFINSIKCTQVSFILASSFSDMCQ